MSLRVTSAIVIRVMKEMVIHAQTLTNASCLCVIKMHIVPISEEDMTVLVNVVLLVMVLLVKVKFKKN